MTGRSCSNRDADNLQIILRQCEKIEHFIQLHGSDEEDLRENMLLQYGCVFSLEKIGEHIRRLSSETREGHPDVDWRGLTDLGGTAAQNYDNVDIGGVRSAILDKVPPLAEACRSVLKDLL